MKSILFFFVLIPLYLVAQPSFELVKHWGIADEFHVSGDRINSLNTFHFILDSLKANKPSQQNDFEIASTYDKLGSRFQNYGEWDLATAAYVNGILVLENYTEFSSLKADINLHLGLLYVKLGGSEQDYYLDLAEELALKSYNNHVLFVVYKVRHQFDKGISFAKSISNNTYLANYYYYKARGDSAILYFDSARMVLPKLPEAALQNFQYHAFIVGYFLNEFLIDSALYHNQQAEKIAPLLNDDEVEIHYLGNYAQIYLEMNAYKKAFDFKFRADSIQQKLRNVLHLEALNSVTKMRYSYTKQKEIIELKSQRMISVVMLLCFAFALVIFTYFFRKSKRLNKELYESNKTKERLFSIISHDLRGPLASLKLYNTIDMNIAENKEMFKIGIDSILFEFDNLLFWSARQLNRITFNPVNVDLAELIEDNCKLQSAQITSKNLVVQHQFEGEFGAYADEQMMNVCIRNVLNNAVKYSAENSEIIIDLTEGENTRIVFTNTTSELIRPKGLGLGLDICKDFIKINKGTFETEERGNVFKTTITLPSIVVPD